jgi:hypothetical protein
MNLYIQEIVIKNPEYAPKDLQQVHSNKHYKSSNATVDDEMANVLSLDNNHDFVQEVVYAKDNKKSPLCKEEFKSRKIHPSEKHRSHKYWMITTEFRNHL